MLPERRAFYVQGDDGQNYGPVELDELREWVRENRAGLGTSVKPDDEGAIWLPWHHYPELVALLAEAHATGGSSNVSDSAALPVAPVWRRVVAWMMDIMLLALVLSLFRGLLDQILPLHDVLQAVADPNSLQNLPAPLLLQVIAFEIIVNACLVLYLTGFHAAYGRTPAKGLLRIQVVDQNGLKPNITRSFVRAVALILSVNLFFVPLLYAFLNPQRRTLHDLLAGTFVVEA